MPDLDPQTREDLRALVRFGGVGLVAAAVATGAGYQADIDTPPWIVGAMIAIAGLVLAAGAIVANRYRPLRRRGPTQARRWRSDRESGGLKRVELTLDRGLADVDRFNDRVRPWLVRLAEQRLRHRAAIDPRLDPDTARTLLGGSLWQLMTQPLTTAPSRRQLAEWVTRLEQL